MGRRGAALEINANVEAEPPPPESGGENAASLFDATSDARVRILRREDSTQKFVTHGYFPPDVNEEVVNGAFGGGYYKAQLVIPDPQSGRLVIKRARDFRIPGAYKPPQKISTFEEAMNPPAPTGNGAAVASPLAGQLPSTNELMQALSAGVIGSVIDLLKSMREVKVAPPQDNTLMVEFMKAQTLVQQQAMQAQQNMMQLMMTLATKDKSEDKDTLAMMAKMKEILAPAVANGADPMKMFNTMLETFTRLRETAEDIAPQRGGEEGIWGALPKLAEVVVEQHQMQKAERQHITSTPVPGPAGGVAHMPAVSTLPPTPQLPMWQAALRQQAKRLIAAAVAKDNPEDFAGLAVMLAPPALKESFAIFFHREEELIFADVLTEVPQMAEHREWLAEFVEAVQYRLFPGEFADEGEDTPESGDDTARG